MYSHSVLECAVQQLPSQFTHMIMAAVTLTVGAHASFISSRQHADGVKFTVTAMVTIGGSRGRLAQGERERGAVVNVGQPNK